MRNKNDPGTDAMLIPAILFFLVGQVYPQGVKKPLILMHSLPMSGNVWFGGGACLPPIEMALRHINARDDILSEYELQHVWTDSKCNAGFATNDMYEMLYAPPTKIMIIGPGCSVEAEVTAQASYLWNITHISWAASSPILSDRTRFPRFLRLNAPDTVFNPTRLAIMQYYNWRKVATIHTAQDFFSAVIDDFVQRAQVNNITIITQEIFSPNHDPLSRLENIKKQDARIIVSASYEDSARKILCAAYRVGLYGPKIVWIFPGWYKDYWWRDLLDDIPCSEKQMDIIERGIANMSSPEFYDSYRQEPLYKEDMEPFEFICGNCYDTIWAAALALDCADKRLKEIGHPRTLDQCQYEDSVMYDTITDCTFNVSFVGVTGKVSFGANGDPIKDIKITQIQDLQRVHVGTYFLEDGSNRLGWEGDGIRWPNNVPPRDSTLIFSEEITIPAYLYTIFTFFGGLGALLAIGFLIFNVVHRNNTYVKLSSPNINNVLLLGCVITYSTVFLYELKEQTATVCKVRTFTFTIGFSMAFGALFSKTWRVYRIFANKKLLRLKIQDSQLLGFVAGLLVILCVVLIIWEIVDPQVIVITFLPQEAYMAGNDAEILPFIRRCVSNYHTYFSWTIYTIEGVLLAFGAFLSFETRKVKIAALNDSRLIGMCLYNVVVLAALGLTLSLALQEQIALMYGVISGCIIVGTTTTQLIVFVPKVMGVYCPHRIDPDEPTLDGTRAGTVITRRFEPRDPSFQKTISTIKPSSSNTNE